MVIRLRPCMIMNTPPLVAEINSDWTCVLGGVLSSEMHGALGVQSKPNSDARPRDTPPWEASQQSDHPNRHSRRVKYNARSTLCSTLSTIGSPMPEGLIPWGGNKLSLTYALVRKICSPRVPAFCLRLFSSFLAARGGEALRKKLPSPCPVAPPLPNFSHSTVTRPRSDLRSSSRR